MDSAAQPVKPASAHGPRHVSGTVIAGIFVVLFAAVALGAAAYLKLTPHPIQIKAILTDLRQYDGMTVTVQGTAKNAANLGGMKWYYLEDPSASIMVVTERG